MTQSQPARPLMVREKLLTHGAHALSDTELLAAFISSGSQKRSCVELAHDALDNFGDLRAILNTDLPSFQKIHGLGLVRYVQLQAAREICRRNDFIDLQKQLPMTHARQTHLYLKRQLRDKKNETFVALFLDNQHRVLAYEELFSGTINRSTVHLRPIIARVLHHNAAALVVAHNHPSGVMEASPEDIALTTTLIQALALMDVRLLDHLIIGDNAVYSILNGSQSTCY